MITSRVVAQLVYPYYIFAAKRHVVAHKRAEKPVAVTPIPAVEADGKSKSPVTMVRPENNGIFQRRRKLTNNPIF